MGRRNGFPFPIYRRQEELPAIEIGDRLEAARAKEPTPAAPTNDDWWKQPYAGGPMVKVDGFPRALYPPNAEKGPSSDGPDVTAYKRTVSRLGRWPWEPDGWDDSFSNAFSHGREGGNVRESGVAGVQRQGKIEPDSGWVGEETFKLLRSARVPEGLPHAGEMAMDGVAAGLVDDAYQRFHGQGSLSEIEAHIYDYLHDSINAEPKLHYEQFREMNHLGIAPASGFTCDCSGHSTSAYYWARKMTGVAVPDPNHSGYNGYGYTGTLVNNPWVGAPYKVGDLGIYGNSTGDTEHVVTCMVAGDSQSSVWCSMGSEAAPYAVELHYRGDLLCVVRPGLLP